MESAEFEQSRSTPKPPLAEGVQAHLGRASRFADEKTRNWTVFFFFRIMSESEVGKDAVRLKSLVDAVNNHGATGDKVTQSGLELRLSLENPALLNASRLAEPTYVAVTNKETETNKEAVRPDPPADLFLDWLKLLTDATTPSASFLGNRLKTVFTTAGVPPSVFGPSVAAESSSALAAAPPVGVADLASGKFQEWLGKLLDGLGDAGVNLESPLKAFPDVLKAIARIFSNPTEFRDAFTSFGETPSLAGSRALAGGLPQVCLYELLRQTALVYLPVKGSDGKTDLPGIMRVEDAALYRGKKQWDPVPINFAFTYSGLTALQLDGTTLFSFPDAFREGMAARAERLGDTGPSAPEHWYGALGLKKIHGYFTGGFLVGGEEDPVKESLWRALRDDVRAFNELSDPRGLHLRRLLGALFRLVGLEIVHLELGEDPYDVDEDGYVQRLPYRKEHFGFRDGISQPFVDLDLKDGAPGSGTPSRDRTWAPVAPGEIYLDQRDEDGNVPQQPIVPLLRQGGTFLVFRKLEQDVAGFRIFLAGQRPGAKDAQTKLASQFVGRWPNGTPLVLAPDAALELGPDPDGLINDFLYAADDPHGARCPLGAHVRRTNPRDIGGTNDVRRHRILRRSIGYGGPLLPEGTLGDGNKRGLLFVAANSRIDLQFEVIQADWINKGELLGQAGLGRCPLTGANHGGTSDSFLEAGAVAPVTGLPRFVITRGGDYFFAPGLAALKAIADGCKFVPLQGDVPYDGYSMGDATTPVLFDVARLQGYAYQILAGIKPVIEVAQPPANPLPDPQSTTDDPQSATVAFVGQLQDVKQVLSNRVDSVNGGIISSIEQYRTASRRISRGRDMLVGTEPGSDTAATRERMQLILNEAWMALGPGSAIYPRLQAVTKRGIEAALRRTGPSHRIDLVHDLAAASAYGVLQDLFGTPGPDWLTEMAVALPFANRHVGELEPDWIAAARAGRPDNPGLATLQIWSIALAVDIVVNYTQQQELMDLSNQAGSELLTHLDTLLATARARREPAKTNLVAAFVSLEPNFTSLFGCTSDDYYTDVRMLLLELVNSVMAVIPATFGAVMGTVLKHDIPLTALIPILLKSPMYPPPASGAPPEDGVARLIYETWRLDPSIKLLMRRCKQDDMLPSGATLTAGNWTAALIAAACFDPRGFPEPLRFSLSPFLPGPQRRIENYLLFGAAGSGKECWGRDRLVLHILKECIKAAGRLQGLRPVAGDRGQPKRIVEAIVGLSARFVGVLPDWS